MRINLIITYLCFVTYHLAGKVNLNLFFNFGLHQIESELTVGNDVIMLE